MYTYSFVVVVVIVIYVDLDIAVHIYIYLSSHISVFLCICLSNLSDLRPGNGPVSEGSFTFYSKGSSNDLHLLLMSL